MKRLFNKKFVLSFIFIYTLIFAVYSLFSKNVEFVYYSVLMLLFISYIYNKQHELWLSNKIIISLALVGVLHLLGGVSLGAQRIYDIVFFGGIRYDNVIHTLSMFIITLVSYNLIHPYVNKQLLKNKFAFFLLIFLVAMGIGALNEVIEFSAVLFLNASSGVGDFYNTGWDLIFNCIGSLIALHYIPRK